MSTQPTQPMIWHPTEKRMVPRPREFRSSEDFDKELERPEYTTMAAELELLASRKMTSSPAQNVEWALMQYERNLADSRPQTWSGQERWQGRENEDMRLVNILSPTAFMRRLRRAGVDARDTYHRNARVFLNEHSIAGRVGVNAKVRLAENSYLTLTTLQYPYGPEYSIMRFNEYNVPTREKYRGWRTALLELIRTQIITEREAERAFGRARGPAADFYLRQVQEYRQQQMGLIA